MLLGTGLALLTLGCDPRYTSAPDARQSASSIVDAGAYVSPASKPRVLVSIDFDDGYESAYQVGEPIFRRAGLPTTHYVVTAWAGKPGYISWDQVRALAASGSEVGSHTRTHRNLAALSPAAAWQEVEGSILDLNAHGIKPTTFAYPGGEFNDVALAAVRLGGFRAARTTRGGFNDAKTPALLLHCLTVLANTTFDDIKQSIDVAARHHTWLIVLFHRVDEDGNLYSARHELLQATADYLRAVDANVVTNAEGIRILNVSTKVQSLRPCVFDVVRNARGGALCDTKCSREPFSSRTEGGASCR